MENWKPKRNGAAPLTCRTCGRKLYLIETYIPNPADPGATLTYITNGRDGCAGELGVLDYSEHPEEPVPGDDGVDHQIGFWLGCPCGRSFILLIRIESGRTKFYWDVYWCDKPQYRKRLQPFPHGPMMKPTRR